MITLSNLLVPPVFHHQRKSQGAKANTLQQRILNNSQQASLQFLKIGLHTCRPIRFILGFGPNLQEINRPMYLSSKCLPKTHCRVTIWSITKYSTNRVTSNLTIIKS